MIQLNETFRYLVCAPDLNAHGTLHGGELLRWIDEAAGMHSRKITRRVCVTVAMSDVRFVSKAKAGDIMRITTNLRRLGNSSLHFGVSVVEDISGREIANVGVITFVSIDHQGNPVTHGVTL